MNPRLYLHLRRLGIRFDAHGCIVVFERAPRAPVFCTRELPDNWRPVAGTELKHKRVVFPRIAA